MNFYNVLGVDQKASTSEIKKIYKKLARQYHPDVNPDPAAEEKFKEISTAYATIGDEDKRRAYDNELKRQSMPFQGGFQGGFGGFSGAGHPDVFDPFNMFFREVGAALHISARIQLAFLDAKQLQTKTIKFNRKIPCKSCDGSGAKSFHTAACGPCKGRGTIVRVMGAFHATQACGSCGGKGKQIKEVCNHCAEGLVTEVAELTVNIPAGILSGKVLRLAGEGNRSTTGRGDLRLHVEILPDARWDREGANVISPLEVPYYTLVLGGEIEIETIWGKEKIKIPAKTKTGAKMALHGKGFPRLGSISDNEKGIHYLIVNLKIPEQLTAEQKSLLKEMQRLDTN